jgi:hypothetical protein
MVAMPCVASGPGSATTVVADGTANIKPDGAWRGGIRGIRLATLRSGHATAPEDVSTGRSNYSASIAVESNGNVAIAWHTFRENNYDIYLRRRAKSGEWTPEQRLITAPAAVSAIKESIFCRPVITTDPEWPLSWAPTPARYHIGICIVS